MFWLKQCPRCHGDLIGESDVHGSYVSCLQCGHLLTADEERSVRRTDAATNHQRPNANRAGAA
jgi:hypothetical protein